MSNKCKLLSCTVHVQHNLYKPTNQLKPRGVFVFTSFSCQFVCVFHGLIELAVLVSTRKQESNRKMSLFTVFYIRFLIYKKRSMQCNHMEESKTKHQKKMDNNYRSSIVEGKRGSAFSQWWEMSGKFCCSHYWGEGRSTKQVVS